MVRIVMGVTTLDIDDGGRHGVGAVLGTRKVLCKCGCTRCTTQTITLNDVITIDALNNFAKVFIAKVFIAKFFIVTWNHTEELV